MSARPSQNHRHASSSIGSVAYSALAGVIGISTIVAAVFVAVLPRAQAQSSGGSCTVVGTADLHGHWKFDDATGLTALDASGGNYSGMLQQGATWSLDAPTAVTPNPGSLAFDGTDDFVSVNNSAGLGSEARFGTGTFTVAAFVKTNAGNRSVLGTYNGRGWGLYLYGDNRVNFFGYGTLGTTDTAHSATVIDNQWHHVAGVYTRSGSTLKIDTYVDGMLKGSQTAVVGDLSVASDLLLGKYLLQPSYKGNLDDVRIYSRALTAAEVRALAVPCTNGSSSSNTSSVTSSTSSTTSSTASSASSNTSSTPSSSVSSTPSSIGNAPTCNGLAATIFVEKRKSRGSWFDGWFRKGRGRDRDRMYVVGGPMNGQEYTGLLRGTAGNDVIVGTNGNDTIGAKAGNDTICALQGDDFIYGDAGNDYVLSGNGRNVVIGNAGDDTLAAGNGRNVMLGNAGNDSLKVGNGNNVVDGGAGTNTCTVGNGNNIVLNCQQGSNTLGMDEEDDDE
jgi:Ca2+-binding RTX toxin-like protein